MFPSLGHVVQTSVHALRVDVVPAHTLDELHGKVANSVKSSLLGPHLVLNKLRIKIESLIEPMLHEDFSPFNNHVISREI